jgi:hypothetical protein
MSLVARAAALLIFVASVAGWGQRHVSAPFECNSLCQNPAEDVGKRCASFDNNLCVEAVCGGAGECGNAQPYLPAGCDDNSACTIDSCDPCANNCAGACVHQPDLLAASSGAVTCADGGRGNPAIQGDHMKVIDALAAKGVGLGFAHYGVEVPAGPPGEAMHRWIGGYYEDHYSVNPMWKPPFDKLPQHPITRGVGPQGSESE